MKCSRVTRRRFTKTAISGAAAGTVGLSGCSTERGDGGGGDENGGKTLRVSGVVTPRIDDWSGFYESTDVADVSWSPITNVAGKVASRVNEGEMEDKFTAFLNDSTMEDVIPDVLRTMDTERIENWDKVPDVLKTSHGGNDYIRTDNDGRLVGVPVVTNADSFLYNEDETGEIDSYGAWFDEQWKGKVGMADNWSSAIPKVALYLKHHNMADISSNTSNMDPDEIKATVDFLIENKDQFGALWSSYSEGVNLITSGDVQVMDGWYPMVLDAQSKGLDGVRYADVEEGYMKWSINAYLFNGEESKKEGMVDAGYQFLNYLLSGEYAAKVADSTGYITATPDAVDYAQEHSDEFDAEFIQQRFDRVLRGTLYEKGSWWVHQPEHADVYEQQWQRFKNA